MHLKVAVLIALLSVVASTTTAQTVARSVNPEAVEFETPVAETPGLIRYRVDLFVAGADTERDTPVASMELPPDALGRDGRVRVELKNLILEAPDGRYVATLRAVAGANTRQSQASDPFVLARESSPEGRVAEEKRERFWTKVGIAIGASLLLLPLIF